MLNIRRVPSIKSCFHLSLVVTLDRETLDKKSHSLLQDLSRVLQDELESVSGPYTLDSTTNVNHLLSQLSKAIDDDELKDFQDNSRVSFINIKSIIRDLKHSTFVLYIKSHPHHLDHALRDALITSFNSLRCSERKL